jgi:GDP-L-fucose synthase
MPTNLYGPNDNFDLETAHVAPALMRRMHEAKLAGAAEVVVWGSGTPRRELLHVDDCADALVHMMKTYRGYDHLNVGSGKDTSIRNLAELIAAIVGFEGALRFDTSRPDGTPRKLLDIDRILGLGWNPKIDLKDGLTSVYEWFQAHAAQG